GPYWGFKRVTQTFELTNSPKRLKPIDVYYHLYSGSKKASLNALRYVFNWVLQQEVMPIFTSEYIPKVMDYFTVSIAKEGNTYLYEGMKDLKTLRVEQKGAGVELKNSQTTLGVKHFEDHSYIALDYHRRHILTPAETQQKDEPYLIRANGKIKEYTNTNSSKHYIFSSHLPLELSFFIPKQCKLSTDPRGEVTIGDDGAVELYFQFSKKVTVDVRCRY
ncbi:MAG: hypothetical protein ACP5D3_02070, partial [Sulfurovum sp.]